MTTQDDPPAEDSGGALGGWSQDTVDVQEGARGTAGGLDNAVSFTSDPIAYLFDQTRQLAQSLAETVLPALFEATKPDFSMDWFLEAYRVSYAVGVCLWIVVLLYTITQSALGRYTANDVMEALTVRSVQFFALCTFGPAAGWVLMQTFSALAEGIAGWATNSSVNDAVEAMAQMIADADGAGVVGGVPMALLLMIFMVIGLGLVAIMLFVTMVAVYIGGALAPVAWSWLVSPEHRPIANRMIGLIIGVMAAKPVLFLVLGIAYRMQAGNVTWLSGGGEGLQTLANMLGAAAAMVIAGLTPVLLFKLAPASRTGTGQAGSALHTGAQNGARHGQTGSQTQQVAWHNARRRSEYPHWDGTPVEGGMGGRTVLGSGAGLSRGRHEPGPLQRALEQRQRHNAKVHKAGASPRPVKAPAGHHNGVPGKPGTEAETGTSAGMAPVATTTEENTQDGVIPARDTDENGWGSS
ncbi:hypothetical protein GCM10023169_26920 [Georgenia halophila]|uniref:TrbL/VirB6 plasmid conjugal transfer protein n=1 Tax=Georgenia halophila TaxID=620889 RepID=A0ABP8LCR8_9MICO